MLSYRRKSGWARWSVRLLKAFAILILGVELALLIVPGNENAYLNLRPLAWLAMVWLAALWLGPYISAWKQFRGVPAVHGPITLTISESGLRYKSLHGDSTTLWSAFAAWTETKTVFALFPGPRVFITVPKRAFTSDQITDFQKILRRNVQNG